MNQQNNNLVEFSENKKLTPAEILTQRGVILDVMQQVMKQDIHYGKIPGTPKPTLYKPGSEILLSTFRIAIQPHVTDLSTDDVFRYRVESKATSMITGAYLGSGIGECSSNEDKYKWRRVVCDEEWEATPENRRRIKWMKKKNGEAFSVKQVRTNAADLANTVLKIAKKRGQIDATLTITAASDVFQQDLEDFSPELRETIVSDEYGSDQKQEIVKKPTRKSSNGGQAQANNNDVISQAQGKRLYAIYKHNNISDQEMQDFLLEQYGVEHSREIKKTDYEDICRWAQDHQEGVHASC